MFEFTHTYDKEEEKKKEVAGPIGPNTFRGTVKNNPLKKQESADPKEAVIDKSLFAGKSSVKRVEEANDDKDYEEVPQSVTQIKTTSHASNKTSSHKGLLVHFESRCQTKMVIPTRLSELETA